MIVPGVNCEPKLFWYLEKIIQNYHFGTAWFNSSETGKDIGIVCLQSRIHPPTTTDFFNPVKKKDQNHTHTWFIYDHY